VDWISALGFGSFLFILLRRNFTPKERYLVVVVTALALFSLVGVYCGRKMYPHYYLQMGFPFSLVIPLALSLTQIPKRHCNAVVLATLLCAIGVMPIRTVWDFMGKEPSEANKTQHEIANYVASNSSSNDSLFVLGAQPIIYFLSDRYAPTKYFFWLHHCGYWQEILNMEKEAIAAFTDHMPHFIVFKEHDLGRVDYIENIIEEKYCLDKTFDDISVYKLKVLD